MQRHGQPQRASKPLLPRSSAVVVKASMRQTPQQSSQPATRSSSSFAAHAAAPTSSAAASSSVVPSPADHLADAITSAANNAAAASVSACPVTRMKMAVSGMMPAAASTPPASSAGGIVTPGPPAFSWEALQDVSVIFSKGLHEAMLRFSIKYGPVCRFANPTSLNGASGWLFLNGPDDVQHVCAANVRNYGRRYLPDIYAFVTHGKGILGSQDDYNARHRRLCGAPFRNKHTLTRFGDVVVARAQQLADVLAAASLQRGAASGGQGLEADMAVQCQRLALDIVGLTAFSHDFQQVAQAAADVEGQCSEHRMSSSAIASKQQRQQQQVGGSTSGGGAAVATAPGQPQQLQQGRDALVWAVNTFGSVLAEVFITPLPLLQLMERFGAPHLKQLNSAVTIMRHSMLQVIHDRRQQLAAGGQGHDDLLNALLTTVDEQGQALTDEELWEDVHDVMGAGHETTATTTAAVLHAVSAHPDVHARVVKELRDVLGGRPATSDDLPRLPYLSACVKEALRLYPAIPVFPREAQKGDVLPSGHVVKAGDVVFMSSYALGRSPALWPDPERFDPERFSPENEAKLHRFQWLPFGAGPRMCLGASFATMSVSLMVATLLQRLHFTPLAPADAQLIPVEYDITMNFNSTNGLRMAVKPRAPEAA